MNRKDGKLGVALVGLGTYSTEQLAPALKETEHCYLAGIVTGNRDKAAEWKRKHDLNSENIYDYESFDRIKDNPDIDIVYVVLPNAMHAEYVIRAAAARKHVIVEKPMATTIEDCHRMIAACAEADVKLSVGYRLHFDPYNKEMMRLGQHELMGHVHQIIADDSMEIGDKNQWRVKYDLAGGGPLMNNGVYCIQAAIYVTGKLPVRVRAEFSPITDPGKFQSVEEGISWIMEFPDGSKALCESSYSKNGNLLRAETANGWFELGPAYEYKGLKGKTSAGKMDFPTINQQAAQMDDFAWCIKNEKESKVPGEMGLRDVEIILAIYESARTGQPVELNLQPFNTLIEH